MKIIAHRGWAKGKDENTIVSFEKSYKNGNDGVEFDVRWSHDCKTPVVSHDPSSSNEVLTLKKALEFLKDKGLELFLELKEYDDELFDKVKALVEAHELKTDTIIFGFPKIARRFPFHKKDGFKLGMIIHPWSIRKDILRFNPDFVFMGYTSFLSKVAFGLYWRIFPVSQLIAKYPNINFVIGVVESKKEAGWLLALDGLYSLTVEEPFI